MTPLEYVYLASVMLGGGYLAIASLLHFVGGDHGGHDADGLDADAGGLDADVDAGGFDVDVDAGGFDVDVDAGGFDADVDAGGFDADVDAGGFDADIDGGGLDADGADAHHALVHEAVHNADVSFLSPLVISTLLFSFGVMGFLVDHWITELALVGFAAALAGGTVGGGGAYYGLNRLSRVAGGSETRVRRLIGHRAEVSVAIPTQGFGEIVYVQNQTRYNAPARSRGDAAIPRGANVFIGGIDGSTFLVEEAKAERIRRLAAERQAADDGTDPKPPMQGNTTGGGR